MHLQIQTPRWAVPLLKPCRYKGVRGGRGSGKSHFFAELLVEEHVSNPDQQSVCIREIQRSLKFSAKKLIEDKIYSLGVAHLFDITQTEIRNVKGRGIIIFQGMQDHTADSIKSLEGFDRAWVEEAQSLSSRSMELLLPTIRATGSEIWFGWNPENETDPVESLFKEPDSDCARVHVDFTDNPFLPKELADEAARHQRVSPETYGHVWLGEFAKISNAQIFKGKYSVRSFEVDESFGDPLHGSDFGFAQDPTTAVRCYVKSRSLFISHACGRVGLELDETAGFIRKHVPDIEDYAIRADSARPESISYLQRHGLPKIEGVKKGAGSVEDGIEFLKSFDEIVINEDLVDVIAEFRNYSYKTDKRTGDVLPIVIDAWNHYIDAIRYALQPLMKPKDRYFVGMI